MTMTIEIVRETGLLGARDAQLLLKASSGTSGDSIEWRFL
jgi:hypothetical protein